MSGEGSKDEPTRVKVHDRRVRSDDEEVMQDEPAAEAPSELEEAQRVSEERLDQLLRLKADYENFRKRVIREQTEIVERASRRIVERLLPVLDDFERAVSSAREHGDAGMVRGIELVLSQLREVLASEGLERVEAEGSPFDPHVHEAMSSHPGDVEEPTVLEVVRPGYRLKGKTIRPALVRVSTPRDDESE